MPLRTNVHLYRLFFVVVRRIGRQSTTNCIILSRDSVTGLGLVVGFVGH
jgi:hypothetical protein